MQIIKLCLAQCWNFSIPLIPDVGIPEAGNRNLSKMIPALKVFHKNPLFLYLISSKPTIYFNETVFNRNIISLFVFSRTGSVRTNVWNSDQCKSSWIRIQANTIATKKSQNPYKLFVGKIIRIQHHCTLKLYCMLNIGGSRFISNVWLKSANTVLWQMHLHILRLL